jgi:hypothetical protein
MRNQELARDYVTRAAGRLKALDVLYDDGHWADVVREAQEVVELALKAVLRAHGVDPPRVHDVSDVLLAEQDRLPAGVRSELGTLVQVSRSLRRDRELAFYGAEDLVPSGFYSREDATRARDEARLTVSIVRPHV